MAIYRLVSMVEGTWITNDFNEGNVIPAMEVRGYTLNGQCRRKQLRAELQGQPMFKGLAGPMWGGEAPSGEPIIRYECSAAYSMLSA